MYPGLKHLGLYEPCPFRPNDPGDGLASTMTAGDTPGSRRKVLHEKREGPMYPSSPLVFPAKPARRATLDAFTIRDGRGNCVHPRGCVPWSVALVILSRMVLLVCRSRGPSAQTIPFLPPLKRVGVLGGFL